MSGGRGDDRDERRQARHGGEADQDAGCARSPCGEGGGLLAHVAEVTATLQNVGDAIAGETTARFWVRGEHVDRELRVIHP